mmetsp:Transcript_2459/g.3600  ORF Transcript_2459/g.3600 Transcript_2459/m.3600 type:complete len:109 (+) Transcript_2459:782-1108(+)
MFQMQMKTTMSQIAFRPLKNTTKVAFSMRYHAKLLTGGTESPTKLKEHSTQRHLAPQVLLTMETGGMGGEGGEEAIEEDIVDTIKIELQLILDFPMFELYDLGSASCF